MTNEDVRVDSAATARLQRASRGALGMLAAVFLLGMAVNLIGLPQESTGGAKAATTTFLILHALVGLGLLGGGFAALRPAATLGGRAKTLTQAGLLVVLVTVVAGILTSATKSNWWSYLMAAGFLAALYIYGSLAMRLRTFG
jgi:peptidoglycan/LPS O-acetylase OafA/YrhL